jgi:hypothetical protein
MDFDLYERLILSLSLLEHISEKRNALHIAHVHVLEFQFPFSTEKEELLYFGR